jgi:transcriptional regulator with PAS, ATPase and Fis domain
LPIDSQAKLLRILEERKIDRLGGTSPIFVNFRLITATNRDLAELVRSGKFRNDLFYRINEFPLEIPPLRGRLEDISYLAKRFLSEVCHQEGLASLNLSKESIELLQRHNWPGNVRELRSLIRQMAWKSQGTTIQAHHFPAQFHKGRKIIASGTLADQLIIAERQAIESALQQNNGNRSLTARILGIHRTALYKKMNRLKIV